MIRCGIMLLFAMLVGGCGPRDAVAPAATVKTEAELRREKWFGSEIAARSGIQWRSSGLGVEMVEEGSGPNPTAMDRVLVHYRGSLVDGTEFDSSHGRGEPSRFRVGDLITGWAAAMPLMRPGGKAVFYIPPHLGYGGLRAGRIPPHSALIFEVELLEIITP